MEYETPTPRPAARDSGTGKGFLALAVTLFIPALHLLAGRRRRAAGWMMLFLVLFLIGVATLTFPSLLPAAIVLIPAGLGLKLILWIDAWRAGRRSRQPMLGRPIYRYLAGSILILLALFAHPVVPLAWLMRDHLAETFIVPSAAMAPTIQSGDRFICHKRVEPRRWDVVAFLAPDEGRGRDKYVMRLIGLPGEQVEIIGNTIHIDGQAIATPAGLGPYEGSLRAPGYGQGNGCQGNPIRLGNDEYYFLGDNSPIAGDSRYWRSGAPGHQPGTIGRADIIGRATYIYWPVRHWGRLSR